MLLIDRRYLQFFDWISFLVILIISSIGLAFVYSATYTVEQPYSIFFKKQLFGMISGLGIYIFFCFCDYRTLERWGYGVYFATIMLLVFTIIKGSIGMGAQRWINLGIVKFQPSELTKLFFPAYLSFYIFNEYTNTTRSFKYFIPPLIVLSLSCLLIKKQPDLGTALIVFFSGLLLLWLAGLNKKFYAALLALSLCTAPLLWTCLKPYQKKRIEVFLGGGDSKKERYQIEQSKIAIGSGGLLGKGFLKGTQNKLLFLPESRTDFIFAVLCEELGFIGALCLIVLYCLLFIRVYYVISSVKNYFAQLLAAGLIIPIILSTIINIGMVLGLLPIVGIPLPFMSYGISHTWIAFANLGWYNGIAMRRFYLSVSSTPLAHAL